MSLDAALASARAGLSLVNRQLAQSSADIANAGTAGYTNKRIDGTAVYAEGKSFGVRAGVATRAVDEALVARMDRSRSAVAAATTRETLLARIEVAHGSAEGGESIGDLMGALRSAFVDLRDAPGEAVQQTEAVRAAEDIAARFQSVSTEITATRQAAQDGLVEEVRRINVSLRDIARLTEEIQTEKAAGRSVANQEDARDAAIAELSGSLEVQVLRRNDGGVTLIARGGTVLPLEKNEDAFSIEDASLGPQAYYGPPAGTLPGVLLRGADVTGRLGGGRLSAYTELRDATLPRMQAELDVAAAQLADRFEEQGLRLFTDRAGGVPDPTTPYSSGGWIGFASEIRVSSAVASDPTLVRDGTHVVTGSPTGASAFTPNPAGGPASFTTLIDRVLNQSFGSEAQAGVAQPGFATTGLGPSGTLSSTLAGPRTLEEFSALLVARQTGERAAVSDQLAQEEALLSTLETRFDQASGVDVDAEMAQLVQLQTAYAANARIVSAVQQMYDQLLAAVR